MKVCVLISVILMNCCFAQMDDDFFCDGHPEPLGKSLICTGVPNCNDCSDEQNCTGQPDFLRCGDKVGPPFCVAPNLACNGVDECGNCVDEMNCPNSTLFFCDDGDGCVDFNIGRPECLRQEVQTCPYFCDGFQHCRDGSDERAEGFGFKCVTKSGAFVDPVTSRCILPQRFLGRSNYHPSICRNGADQCFVVTEDGTNVFDDRVCWTCLDGTIIQRQQVCDSVFDCPDLSDECLCFGDRTNNISCEPFLNNENCLENQLSCPAENKCINVTQICDQIRDCGNGLDEAHCSRNNVRGCGIPTDDAYKCPSAPRGEKMIPIVCDGFPDCVFAEDECESNCTHKPEYCDRVAQRQKLDTLLKCKNQTEEPEPEFVKNEQLCDNIRDCSNGFDEEHCIILGNCTFNNAAVKYDNRECGPDRCNLQAACDNVEDELNCSSSTHFYCDGNTKFIPQWHRFDGSFDCDDFSDECVISDSSVSSPAHLIRSGFLNVCLWIIMVLSLIGNGIVIIRTLMDLYNALRRRLPCTINRVGVCNKIMIVNLAIADFLMGVYLLIIAVKSVEFSGFYCRQRQAWRTSYLCSSAGVLAVISSQTSVLLMVLMTSYRLYGIANPFSAERIRGRMIYLATVVIWIVSFVIAVIPTVSTLDRSFVTSIFVIQPYGENILTVNALSDLITNANKLPGQNRAIPFPSSLDIEGFCSLFSNGKSLPAFCDNSTLENSIGYYGSDGVCLPRYYASANEPVSGYSLAIICLNFAAFLYMFIAYLFIYCSTSLDMQQGDPNSSSSLDENRSKENQALWGKIVRLIVTDFICWVPICIMTFVAFAGVELPPIVYPITAVVLIPINSAANPWLYSSFLAEYIKRLYRYVKQISQRKRKISAQGSTISNRPRNAYFRKYRRKSSMESSITFSVRLSTTGIASGDPHSNGAVATAPA